MNALVTGGAGFIGSHVVDALVARGDSVRVLDDLFSGDRENVNPAATLLVAGVADEDAVRDAVAGVDVVFHQAAQAGVRHSWSDGFADYVGHNVLATQRLLEAVQRRDGACRFVYASSSSVYGNQARYPVRESDLPAPYSPYGVTKLAGEHLCGLYAEN